MKPFEIALFKHFIEGKGMTTVYINLYRKHHIKENPISIEEFFNMVDASKVCIKAFYFVTNERWGYDYWMQTQKEWLSFLDENKKNYSSDEWWKLQGLSKILRYNWDAAKHWKQESRYITALRLGIEPSLLGIEGNKHNEQPTKMSEEYLREKDLEAFKNAQDALDASKQKSTTHELIDFFDNEQNGSCIDVLGELGDFVDVDLKPKSSDKRRLKDDEISVNTRNRSGRITFNQLISKTVKERGGYEYAALLRNKQGDVIIKLNDEKGVLVQDGTRTREKSNVVIHSLVFTQKLVDFLGIERDYEIMKVKEVAKTNDYVAYLVTSK